MSRLLSLSLVVALPLFAACGDEEVATLDPGTAPRVVVDRFSAIAGHLMVRDADNGLPAAGAPVDFDEGPFVTTGLSPSGQPTRYYNFDVQPTTPASIYVLVSGDQPVEGQLNIVDAVPGDAGYNDFWRVVMVAVPDDYVANSVTSLAGIQASGFAMTPTENLVNCPIVPEGSMARSRFAGASADLHRGWYRDRIVTYFTFEERALVGTVVPTSPIYVTFNVNPGQDGGGPPSGFVTEPGTDRTHNVVATSPAMAGYSPLWAVQIYDNADFASVSNLATAQQARVVARDAALVNCPIIE